MSRPLTKCVVRNCGKDVKRSHLCIRHTEQDANEAFASARADERTKARREALEEAIEILHEEGWLGDAMARIKALLTPTDEGTIQKEPQEGGPEAMTTTQEERAWALNVVLNDIDSSLSSWPSPYPKEKHRQMADHVANLRGCVPVDRTDYTELLARPEVPVQWCNKCGHQHADPTPTCNYSNRYEAVVIAKHEHTALLARVEKLEYVLWFLMRMAPVTPTDDIIPIDDFAMGLEYYNIFKSMGFVEGGITLDRGQVRWTQAARDFASRMKEEKDGGK